MTTTYYYYFRLIYINPLAQSLNLKFIKNVLQIIIIYIYT